MRQEQLQREYEDMVAQLAKQQVCTVSHLMSTCRGVPGRPLGEYANATSSIGRCASLGMLLRCKGLVGGKNFRVAQREVWDNADGWGIQDVGC